jgi:OmpA-OmpF porin, OOP family
MPNGLPLGAVCLTLVMTAVLAGCNGEGDASSSGSAIQPGQSTTLECPKDANKALTLVVGARAGSPKPDLPPDVQQLVRGAAVSKQTVQVVRVDGKPSVALTAKFQTDAKNDTKRDNDLTAFVSNTLQVIKGLKPKEAEADVVGALTEAARVTPEGGTVVLLDSGLPTTGQLSFKDGNMFGADPGDAAAYLESQGLMPRLTGRSLLLVGVGNTAEPQPQLDENLRNRVVKLWQAVAAKAGVACAAELPVAVRRAPFETSIPVSIVNLPPPPVFKACGATTLPDSESVGFTSNTANLRDPDAAKRTLRQLADQLASGTQRVNLVGNTASVGKADENRTFSRQRAEAVKAVLVSLGIDGGRITTQGDGSTGKYHVNDRAPDGALIPPAAAQNRSVVVEVACQA